MVLMTKGVKNTVYAVFMTIYVLLAIFNYVTESKWIFDTILSMGLLTALFFSAKWLKLGPVGFIWANIALLTHNMGMFGAYSWHVLFIEYDNIVHFTSSAVTAWIAFNFLARKLHIKKGQRVQDADIDEHKVIFISLVIAMVAMLGVFVEVLEFGGAMVLGEGEGILFMGPGDTGVHNEAGAAYTDTMSDIMVNTLGSILGVLVYYFVRYRRQPWLKY